MAEVEGWSLHELADEEVSAEYLQQQQCLHQQLLGQH